MLGTLPAGLDLGGLPAGAALGGQPAGAQRPEDRAAVLGVVLDLDVAVQGRARAAASRVRRRDDALGAQRLLRSATGRLVAGAAGGRRRDGSGSGTTRVRPAAGPARGAVRATGASAGAGRWVLATLGERGDLRRTGAEATVTEGTVGVVLVGEGATAPAGGQRVQPAGRVAPAGADGRADTGEAAGADGATGASMVDSRNGLVAAAWSARVPPRWRVGRPVSRHRRPRPLPSPSTRAAGVSGLGLGGRSGDLGARGPRPRASRPRGPRPRASDACGGDRLGSGRARSRGTAWSRPPGRTGCRRADAWAGHRPGRHRGRRERPGSPGLTGAAGQQGRPGQPGRRRGTAWSPPPGPTACRHAGGSGDHAESTSRARRGRRAPAGCLGLGPAACSSACSSGSGSVSGSKSGSDMSVETGAIVAAAGSSGSGGASAAGSSATSASASRPRAASATSGSASADDGALGRPRPGLVSWPRRLARPRRGRGVSPTAESRRRRCDLGGRHLGDGVLVGRSRRWTRTRRPGADSSVPEARRRSAPCGASAAAWRHAWAWARRCCGPRACRATSAPVARPRWAQAALAGERLLARLARGRQAGGGLAGRRSTSRAGASGGR